MFLRTKEKIMSRKPIIAGNWKMNLCREQAKEVFEGVKNFVKDFLLMQENQLLSSSTLEKSLNEECC